MRRIMLAAALLSAGCGVSGLERASVSGLVTLDGAPIEEGSISFIPEGNAGPTAGAAIVGGEYRIDAVQGVVLGRHRIEVRSLGKSGRTIPHPVFRDQAWEETVEIVPAAYNDQSTLMREIVSGRNTIDLHLTSH